MVLLPSFCYAALGGDVGARRRGRQVCCSRLRGQDGLSAGEKQQWRRLIVEYEQSVNARPDAAPPRTTPVLNPAQYEMLPTIESAFMAALTTSLWHLGRVYHLDALFLLMYPVPTIYIASRWGLRQADYTFYASQVLIFTLVGPLYAILYLFNTGLLTLAYSRALCHSLSWKRTLVTASAAKGLGVCLQLLLISSVIGQNAWRAFGAQVTALLTSVVSLLARLGIILPSPSVTPVYIAMVVVLVLHSVYHVFFTNLSTSLMLIKLSETTKMQHLPSPMPLVTFILKRLATLSTSRTNS